jgi:hypothetical protein
LITFWIAAVEVIIAVMRADISSPFIYFQF